MGRIIQVPDERFVRKALVEAEHALFDKTGYRFSLMLDRADEAVLDLSAQRADGAVATSTTRVPSPDWFTTVPRDQVNAWIQGSIDGFVGSLALEVAEDEPAPPREQRFETRIVFSSRSDIVLTPSGGVAVDEAVRVYNLFLENAAAIGGRVFTVPVVTRTRWRT